MGSGSADVTEAFWSVTTGRVVDCSGEDSVALSEGLRPSSSSPPSSSASLELSKTSDSSLIASLMLSSTSTVARENATGRTLRPRMIAYRRLALSFSRLIRSKCLAIFETFVPAPWGGRLNVDLEVPLEVGRCWDISLFKPLEDVFPLIVRPGGGGNNFPLVGGDEDSPTALDLLLSGDVLLEGARDSIDDPPGTLDVYCPCPPTDLLNLGAAFAAYPDSKSDVEGFLVTSCLCLPRAEWRGKTGLGMFTFDRVIVRPSCSPSETRGGASAVLASSSTPVAGIKSW